MNNYEHAKTYVSAGLLLVVALLLTILPLSDSLQEMRPQWLALLTLFWIIAYPEQFGVLWALLCGLALDLTQDMLIGQSGISFSVMGFIGLMLQPRLRVLSIWQQSFFVLLLLLVERVLSLWLMVFTLQPLPPVTFWLPCVIGCLLWLVISRALPDLGVPEQ